MRNTSLIVVQIINVATILVSFNTIIHSYLFRSYFDAGGSNLSIYMGYARPAHLL